MNIISLFCPCTGGEVPVDHYESGACEKPPAPLPWLLATLANCLEDTEHAGNKITATRLSSCPRKTAIEDNLPIYNLNLLRRNSIMWGVAMHLLMEKYSPPGFLAEKHLKGVLFKGTEFEEQVQGRADVIQPGVALLEDYKATSEWSQRYRTEKPLGKLEWDIQFSVYKILDDQSETPSGIQRAGIWSGSPVAKKSKAKPWVQLPVRLMREAEILASRPFEGNATVADHLRIRKQLLEGLAVAAPLDTQPKGKLERDAVAALPMTGMDQAKFVCDYCDVSHICMALSGVPEL